ncbi:uncharacterized protein [Lepeophtheirus salmonis]|nr:zinc finger protein 729-like isoform X2 [Lepeophtheirus salmonis]
MPLIENRIVPSNREEYLEKLAESLKALQEESRFTDVILYSGDGGAGIPIHKTVLKKLSSPLSGMLEDSSCCFCLGTRCLKGSETFGITLQGTKTEDIKALVALIYTGKTPISGPDHYRAIREVAELLQIRLPKSSITLEKDDGSGVEYMEEEEDEDERESVCSRKRKAEIDDDEDAYDSRKIMNRVGSSEEEEEDPYLATKNCPKCNEAFTNQIEYVRHVNACSLREAEKTINTNPPRPRHPCPGCGVLYPDSPWFRQHVKICTSNNKANGGGSGEDVIGLDDNDNYQTCPKCDTLISTNDVGTHVCRATTLLNKLNSISIESTSDNPEGKKLCPKCHRWFFVMKGGYVRHVRACLPMPTTPQVSDSISTVNGIMAEDGKSKACPKCGKVYTPKNYRYFDPHVARCMGPAEPTAVIEPPPPQSGPIQTCKGCNKSFTLNHWYQKHVATCRKRNLDLLQRPGLTITETGSYGCHKCSHTYATRGDLKRHLIQHYGERVRQLFNTSLSDKCSLCPFVAQTSDQMVVHLCLKHEKLRDVIPKDVSRMLYQEIGNNTALNLQQHQQPRQTSPPQQQQQQLQLGVHSMMVQQLPTGTSADIVNNCHVCGKVFNNRTSLRSHIFTHYLNDLRKVYHDPRDPTACIICTYRSSSIHHLMIHVGLKHKKLAEFLPREISAYFFDDNARAFARRPVPTLQPHHQILQQRLQQNNSGPPPPPLKMITMQSKPFIGSRFGHTSTKNWTCMFCYKELGNDKGNLKQHLLCHTRDKIRDHFMNPNNPRSCLFCDYNSNLPDHMITHVGLTHQKIREFLPRDYGDILFRGPYAFELQPSNVAFCEHCTMEFTSVEELEKHLKRNGGNCVWNCPKCGLKTQGRKNVEKHTMHCQRKPSIFNCEVCGLECHDLTTFKSHLCSHFKQELMNVIGSDVSRCDDCGIDFGTDSTGLATHVGTTHDVIFNVIPANLLKKVKSLMMETIYCFICQKEFSTPSDLAGHECIPVEDSDDQADDEFCRLCGEMTITSYQQYKEHLYSHFMNKLNTDFRSDYDKDKKACERCEEPVDDCISYIKHLALDHDEILKYIDEDTMNHLKNVLHKSNHIIGDPMEHASFEMDFSIKDESMSPGYDTEDHDGIICDYSSRDSSGIANNYSNANNDDVFIDVPEEDELDDVEEDHIKNNSSPININNGEIHSHPSPEKIMGETNSFVDSNSFEKSTGSSNLISSNLHET